MKQEIKDVKLRDSKEEGGLLPDHMKADMREQINQITKENIILKKQLEERLDKEKVIMKSQLTDALREKT